MIAGQDSSISPSTDALTVVFDGWDGYRQSLINAVAPLTAAQLAYRVAANLRSVGETVRHLALGPIAWFERMEAPGSHELAARIDVWETDPHGNRIGGTMSEPGLLQTTYVAFAFLFQILLVLDFAARLRRPELERRWGWIVYALGLPALVLGVAVVGSGASLRYAIGPLLYAAWAAVGLVADTLLAIPWRGGGRPGIFVLYVALYTVALFGFLFPLWEIDRVSGIAYTGLYAVHTALNIRSHFPRRPGSAEDTTTARSGSGPA